MIGRRPLHQMLSELGEGVLQAAPGSLVRVNSIEFALPIDLRVGACDELIGDIPQFRQRTAFDPPPARLVVTLEETPA